MAKFSNFQIFKSTNHQIIKSLLHQQLSDPGFIDLGVKALRQHLHASEVFDQAFALDEGGKGGDG